MFNNKVTVIPAKPTRITKAEMKPGQIGKTISGSMHCIRTNRESFVYLETGDEYPIDDYGHEEVTLVDCVEIKKEN